MIVFKRTKRNGIFVGYETIKVLLTYQLVDGTPVSLCQVVTILGGYTTVEIKMSDIVDELYKGNIEYNGTQS